MTVQWPAGFRLEKLSRSSSRKGFCSCQAAVDEWLKSKAFQAQDKHLASTTVLVDPGGSIAGFYTLATSLLDFSDLPSDMAKKLPRRMVPVAVLAWLGVAEVYQGRGFGKRLLSQALVDCHAAGQTFAFVGVVLDCVNDRAKAFYQNFDFAELPGHPYRLFLSTAQLAAMATG